MSPTTTRGNDFQGQSYQPLVDQVAVADGARTARADAADSTLPWVVWFGLIIGGAISIGVMFTLQIRRSGRELLMAGLFSALIAFLLFLVWDFDAPFSRGIAATASPFFALFPHP